MTVPVRHARFGQIRAASLEVALRCFLILLALSPASSAHGRVADQSSDLSSLSFAVRRTEGAPSSPEVPF